MKKSIERILILFTIILIFTVFSMNFTYAAEGSISVPSVTVGQDFTVTVNIPSEAVAYEGKISVTFSDGTSKNSGKLTKVTGIEGDYTHPGNMSYTFNAVKEGNAVVQVTGLIISSKTGQINSNETLEETITIASNTPNTPSTPSTPSTPNTPSMPNTPTKPSEPETPSVSNEPTWRETGDTVYALEDLNVRNGWGTSYNKIGSLKKDSSTKRIAVGSNGWDKIEYNGSTGYVLSKYLTTQKPSDDTSDTTNSDDKEKEPEWRETGDTVYALKKINVRSGWGTSYKAVGFLKQNSSVKRIAVGSNGWDKIEYNGTTAYVMSKYLTTEKPEENENENNEVQNEVDNKNKNVVENNTIDNAEIYNTIVDEVGVIPPVGKSIVDYVYSIAVCISIAIVVFVGIKIRENNKE